MVDPELKALMTQTVTVGNSTGVDEYGKRARAAGVPYPCHVQVKAQEVAGRGGQIVSSTATAWLDDYYPVLDTTDSATVTDLGLVPIVGVTHLYDEAGPYATVLYLGAG